MNSKFAEINRLASDAIAVKHFATLSVLKIESQMPAGEVSAWMSANDFDIAPVANASSPAFVRREEIDKLSFEASIESFIHLAPEPQLLTPDTSLLDCLNVLQKYEWALVIDENKIQGIVTADDLAKPAISIYLFAHLLAIEQGLRRLLGTYTNRQILESPPKNQFDDENPYHLKDVLKKVIDTTSLRSDLGFESKNQFNKLKGWLVELRNDLAHGRSILQICKSASSAVERITHLSTFSSRIQELVNDRDHVWDTFSSTHIIHPKKPNFVWSGPNAQNPTFPFPIHVITAHNPFEQVLSQEANERRNMALETVLKYRNLDFTKVIGQSPDGLWQETSYAVSGLSRDAICELCRFFGQRALFELTEKEMYVIDENGNIRRSRPRNQ